MPDAPQHVFISYARADSRFVNRLQQDLELRDLKVWVDRSRLEGGQAFPQRIQQAIRESRAVLVVLSPDSVKSEWVLDEIHEAKVQQRRIIPLMLRATGVPMEINRVQWVDFEQDYDTGLTTLLRDLIAIPALPPPPTLPQGQAPDVPKELRSALVQPPEPVQPPAPDLEQLQQVGFDALGRGDLEHAVLALEQVHEKDPRFNGGFVARMLPDLQGRVRAQRIHRLRERAHAASAAGNWNEAAGAWEALLGQDADAEAQAGLPAALCRIAEEACAAARWDEAVGAWRGALSLTPEAAGALRAALEAAEQNRQLVYVYNNVRGFVASGNAPAARAMIEALWSQAPAYGDPLNLAPACGLAPRAPGLAGPWAEARFEQFLRARQWADAACIAEMAQRAAPRDAAWQQRVAMVRLAPIQDRYEAAAKAYRWPEALAAAGEALALVRDDPAWQQRQAQARAWQEEEQRWTAHGLPVRLAHLRFALRRGKSADLILPPRCLVPAGPFEMGDDRHLVTLAACEIGMYPVTVAEWKLAKDAGAVGEPPSAGGVTWQAQLQRLDHPVVCVSWLEALKYVEWLARETGEPWRLPTEAEWEKAARWDVSATPPHARAWPWGDDFGDGSRANTSERGPKTTTPVGAYAEKDDASPYGCHDMAGNVWEWTSSIHTNTPYQHDSQREDIRDRTSARVLRGGSWFSGSTVARAAYRYFDQPDYAYYNVGFRLARAAGAGG